MLSPEYTVNFELCLRNKVPSQVAILAGITLPVTKRSQDEGLVFETHKDRVSQYLPEQRCNLLAAGMQPACTHATSMSAMPALDRC